MRDILVLFSGGLDSLTMCHMAGDKLWGVLHFDYGQPAEVKETVAVKKFMDSPRGAGVSRYDLRFSLFDMIAMLREPGADGHRIVRGRNGIFLSFAGNLCASRTGPKEIWIGATKDDQAAYHDCRPEFIHAMSGILKETCGVTCHAPLTDWTKQKIVARARELEVPIWDSWSCYAPKWNKLPCGTCNACLERDAALA